MSNAFDKLINYSPSEAYLANHMHKIIMEEIYDFEQYLDNEHEVALKLCNFGQHILLNVTDIGYHNPNIMFYYGFVDGKEAQLIQNTSQINFLLVAVPKHNPQKPPRRIGFLPQDNEDSDE